jgi:hypothetical protein
VSRERGELSDREVVARLTAAGERLFAEAYPAQHRFVAASFDAALTRGEQVALATLLEKLTTLEIPAVPPTAHPTAWPAAPAARRERARTRTTRRA